MVITLLLTAANFEGNTDGTTFEGTFEDSDGEVGAEHNGDGAASKLTIQ